MAVYANAAGLRRNDAFTPLLPDPLPWTGGVVETGYLNRILAIIPLSS
jgi:hypothetical protein